MLDAADIRQAVSMDTVLAWYGLEPNRAGFIPCPFHGDTDPSLKVFPSGRGWHCFGCGLGSSVIDFVMHMEGLTFRDACKAITERAGLEGYSSMRRDPVARNYAKKFKADTQSQLEQEEAKWRDEVRRYKQVMAHATEWTPELVEACQNIAYAEYRLEVAQGFYD